MPSDPSRQLKVALRSFRGPDAVALVRLEVGEEPARDERGSYALVIELPAACSLAAGRLAPVMLPAGLYVYCGSALGGLRARVARHLRAEKRVHWHVDYLLERGTVAEVWIARCTERLECLLARHLAAHAEGSLAIPRFGASDCRCPGHLVRWDEREHEDAKGAQRSEGISRAKEP